MPRKNPQLQVPLPAQNPIDKVFHSVEEASEILSLSRTFVFALIMGGQIHSVKIGKRRLVAATELDAYAVRLQEGEVV